VIRPGQLDIWIMDADGSNKRRVTSNGAANFAPFMHPDGQRIIFSSNMADPRGRNFDLWIINIDGTGLERVTTHPISTASPCSAGTATAARLRVQPRRRAAGRDQRFHRGLEGRTNTPDRRGPVVRCPTSGGKRG
jgi:hypothetical protein